MATQNDPVAQATSYLNVYKISNDAGSSSTAQLIHEQLTVPGGLFGAIGGHDAGGSFKSYLAEF